MNRRALLANISGGSSVAFAACLDGASEETEDGAPDDREGDASNGTETDGNASSGTKTDGNDDGREVNGNDGPTEVNGTDGDGGAAIPEPDGKCGSEADPLSSVLLDRVDQNEGACHDDLTPSFVVANEREDAVTAAVEITSDGESIFEGSYSLETGERAIEQDVGAVADLESVTVTPEGGESRSEEWLGVACYRHAAVLTDDGLETGYVGPLAGPGDTQHDCYAGDPAPIQVSNGSLPQTVTITVVDHCREAVDEESLPLEAEEVARLENVLTSGGRYDVAVEVEDGGADAAEFHDACWGLSVSIDGGGDVEIVPTAID